MIYFPPSNLSLRDRDKKSVFLAGSIEMGKSFDWQSSLGDWLDSQGFNVFNPRRKDWDSSWKQSHDNANFYQQVMWELNGLEKSDIIIMYLDPETKAPISLLEFGLFAKSKKIYVICAEGFWRKGNIEIVCDVYDIPLFNSIEKFKELWTI